MTVHAAALPRRRLPGTMGGAVVTHSLPELTATTGLVSPVAARAADGVEPNLPQRWDQLQLGVMTMLSALSAVVPGSYLVGDR